MTRTREVELRISELLAARAGIEVLAEIQAIDPMTLDYAGRLEYLETLQKQSGWLDALMQSALFAVAGEAPGKPEGIFGVDELEREDIATALKLSPSTAQSRIDVARTLNNHFPAVCNALAMGEISAQVASVIARESADAIEQGLAPEQIRELEAKALAHAESHSPVQIANKIRTTIAKLAPEEFEERVARAVEERNVYMYPEPHGMATIIALLPITEAQTVMFAIDKMARIAQARLRQDIDSTSSATSLSTTTKSRVPKLETLRADSLADLASQYLATNQELAPQHRRPVSVNLTIDLPTMLGLADNPGQLAGYGPIPASLARELASDGKWKRFITDPLTGNLLDYGRQSYEPPQALVDFILARDQICRFPGCRQPGRVSDIDHAKSWESGGETSPANMGLLCRRHHRVKTHEGWLLESHMDGSCTWISPTGKTIFVPTRPANEVA
jgi:Domain of unknown function (DUF222)/HNH endonuclease